MHLEPPVHSLLSSLVLVLVLIVVIVVLRVVPVGRVENQLSHVIRSLKWTLSNFNDVTTCPETMTTMNQHTTNTRPDASTTTSMGHRMAPEHGERWDDRGQGSWRVRSRALGIFSFFVLTIVLITFYCSRLWPWPLPWPTPSRRVHPHYRLHYASNATSTTSTRQNASTTTTRTHNTDKRGPRRFSGPWYFFVCLLFLFSYFSTY